MLANCRGERRREDSLGYWRDHLFAVTVLYLIPLSLIALIPGIYMAIDEGLTFLIIADTIAVVSIITIALVKGIPIHIRKFVFSTALFIISFALLYYLGTFGPGLMYLLALTVFVVLISEQKYGVMAVALNLLVCTFFGFEIYYGIWEFGIVSDYSLDSWIAVSSNLVFLSALSVILIPIIFRGLQKTLIDQKKLGEDLKSKNLALTQSEENLRKSEARLQGIIDSQTSYVLRTDLMGFYTYYNQNFFRDYGWIYNSEDLIGAYSLTSIKEYDHAKVFKIVEECVANPNKVFQVEIDKPGIGDKVKTTLWDFVCLTNNEGEPSEIQCVGIDITDKRVSEKQLKKSLEEKNVLLAEIHHRVKNNLAVVSGLLQIQAFDEENEEVEKRLLNSIFRIRTMASIHELLYQSSSLAHIDLSKMIDKLSKEINKAFSGDKNIALFVEGQPLMVNINQAIPCGLISNEVLTNVYKHAYEWRKVGNVNVSIEEKDGIINLTIKDDGVGISKKKRKSKRSLGLQLIEILAKQLEGEFDYEATKPGTKFSLTFKKKDLKGSAHALTNKI